jgi:putative transposase
LRLSDSGRTRLGLLKALEDENSKLKKLLVESTLDQAALKELFTKKW